MPVSLCFEGYFVEISDVFWSKDRMFFSETSDVFHGGFSPQARAAPTSRHSAPFPSAEALNGAPFARAGPTSGPGAPMRVNPRIHHFCVGGSRGPRRGPKVPEPPLAVSIAKTLHFLIEARRAHQRAQRSRPDAEVEVPRRGASFFVFWVVFRW